MKSRSSVVLVSVNLGLGLSFLFGVFSAWSWASDWVDAAHVVIAMGGLFVTLGLRLRKRRRLTWPERGALLPTALAFLCGPYLFTLTTFGCGPLSLLMHNVGRESAETVSSPDGRFDAIVKMKGTPAFSSSVSYVEVSVQPRLLPVVERHIRSYGSEWGKEDLPFVSWASGNTLLIDELAESTSLGGPALAWPGGFHEARRLFDAIAETNNGFGRLRSDPVPPSTLPRGCKRWAIWGLEPGTPIRRLGSPSNQPRLLSTPWLREGRPTVHLWHFDTTIAPEAEDARCGSRSHARLSGTARLMSRTRDHDATIAGWKMDIDAAELDEKMEPLSPHPALENVLASWGEPDERSTAELPLPRRGRGFSATSHVAVWRDEHCHVLARHTWHDRPAGFGAKLSGRSWYRDTTFEVLNLRALDAEAEEFLVLHP